MTVRSLADTLPYEASSDGVTSGGGKDAGDRVRRESPSSGASLFETVEAEDVSPKPYRHKRARQTTTGTDIRTVIKYSNRSIGIFNTILSH